MAYILIILLCGSLTIANGEFNFSRDFSRTFPDAVSGSNRWAFRGFRPTQNRDSNYRFRPLVRSGRPLLSLEFRLFSSLDENFSFRKITVLRFVASEPSCWFERSDFFVILWTLMSGWCLFYGNSLKTFIYILIVKNFSIVEICF